MAQYRAALEAYNQAHDVYAAAASAYWRAIAAKRQSRNAKRARGEALSIDDYVLDQPPVYTGPPKPRNPLQAGSAAAAGLCAGGRRLSCRGGTRNSNSRRNCRKATIEFKRAYANVALAAGLTRDQVVRIYGFEATGNGSYDVEAGREYNKHGRAITTALGYNQLLATNTGRDRCRRRQPFPRRFAGQSRAIADRSTMGAGEQDRDLAPNDRVCPKRAGRLGPARNPGQHRKGPRRACAQSRPRRRSLAADAEASGFGRVRAPQGRSPHRSAPPSWK